MHKLIAALHAGPARTVSAALLLALAASMAAAQGIDLGRLLNLPLPARQLQRMGEQQAAQQQCQKLKDWVSSAPAAAGVRRPDEWMKLVDDAVFGAHFGKTYDQLTIEDLRQMQAVLPECRRLGNMTPGEMQSVQMVWNPSTHANLSRQLAAQRGQRSELAGLQQELDRLQPSEADFGRIDAIEARGAALSRSAPAEDRTAFQARVDATRERIGVAVVRERVERAVAQSAGAEGLSELARLHAQVSKARLSAGAVETLKRPLAERIAQLGPAIAQDERSRAPLAVAGVDGLERSVAWIADFDRRYQALMALAPPLAELRRDAVAARSSALESTQGALLATLRGARSEAEVASLLQRHLLAEEMAQGPGRVVKEEAATRSAALQRVAKDEAVFGRQPEHQALLNAAPTAQAVAVASPAAPPAAPAVTRCDELAAHPDDPTRAAPGVADERMAVKAAVSACTDAVKAAPQLARLHFQLGRALLEAKQVKESIAHFERAAAMNHGGAYVYLANAYEVGGGGLKKDAAKAADYARRGAQAGFGSGAAVGSAGAPAAGNVLADARELREKYEDGATMRAVYYGDASALSAEKLYVQAYLLGQVELLAAECNSFKMTEVREFRSSALRSQLPKTENEMAQLGWQQLANSLRVAANAMKNPQSMADVANREQRLEDAPAMGQKDLVTFVTRHGGCGTAPLERYTRNLRAYFSGGATKR